MWQTLIGPISNLLSNILDKVFPDPIKREEIKNQMLTELLKADSIAFENQVKILLAELSGNWLQKSWRPILMLSIVAIVVNNYIVYPYVNLFGFKAIILDLPDKLWNLMQIGVGGYILGRSAEKVVENWKK